LLRELGWMNPIGLQTLHLTNEVPGESLQQKMHFSKGLKNTEEKNRLCLNNNRLKQHLCGQQELIQVFFASEDTKD
jgi:hypothetical protein